MLTEYQKAVFDSFKEKQEKGELNIALLNPTTAKLKKECLRIYDKRYTSEDADVFSIFFDVDKIGANFRQLISKADAGEFRPLLNHLLGKTARTDDKNSELLAWLIDFTPRPSTSYYNQMSRSSQNKEKEIVEYLERIEKPNLSADKKTEVKEECTKEVEDDFKIPFLPIPVSDCHDKDGREIENAIETNSRGYQVYENIKSEFTQIEEKLDTLKNKEIDNDKEDNPVTPTAITNEENYSRGRKRVEKEGGRNKISLLKKWSLGVTAVIILIGFLFFPRYMTWKGDRYEWLIFNTEKQSVVAINWDLLLNFRKVKKDTLTEYSIGKLYYLKEKNDHDVFTMGGKHPLLVNRNLRPLSKTILDSIRNKIRLKKQMQGMMSSR